MVKIYTMNTACLKDEKVFAQAMEELPLVRRKKVCQARGLGQKRQELAAGLLLVYGLKEYGVNGVGQDFATGENGKPYLKQYPGLHFNLTHSGDYAAVAFSEAEVGIDLEHKCRNMEKIAERFFTGREAKTIAACTKEAEKRELFLRYWTLKESVLKVTGLGMRLSMKDFEFTLGEAVRIDWKEPHGEYFFREFEIGGKDAIMGDVQYHLAVCAVEKKFSKEPQQVEYPWKR